MRVVCFCILLFSFRTILGAEEASILTDVDGRPLLIQEDLGTTSFCYDEKGRVAQIVFPEMLNEEGQVVSPTIYYSYDDANHLIEESDGNGNTIITTYTDQGKPAERLYSDGTRESFTYYPDGTLKEFTDRNGVATAYEHDTTAEIPVTIATPTDTKSPAGKKKKANLWSIVWQKATGWIYTASSSMTALKKKISYTDYIQESWDQLADQTFGRGFLRFSGYYQHPVASGKSSFGQEISDKVRVTMINGILNIRSDLEEALKLFSQSHGDTVIHYVFRPTEGWTKDLLTSTLSKFGYTSPYAILLAEKWKELIQEMGGVGGGGTIIHYAHSIGATDTYVAKNLLTKEEQKMLHVVTLGSPSMIPGDAGFASTTNYVSRRDGVCLLDPVGYLNAWISRETNVKFIGSFWGIPLIDHTLYTDSYGKTIQVLGSHFIKTYASLK